MSDDGAYGNRLLSACAYARHRGVSPGTVSRWIKSGRLEGAVEKKGNRYFIDIVKANAIVNDGLSPARIVENERRRRKSSGLPPLTDEEEAQILATGSLEPDKFGHRRRRVEAGQEPVEFRLDKEAAHKARVAKEVFEAKLKELEYRKAAGELTWVHEVRVASHKIGRQLRDAILALGPQLSPEFAHMKSEHAIAVRYRDAVTKAFSKFADELEGLGNGN